MKVLGISGSLRAASFNTMLLKAAQELAPAGMTIEIATLNDIPMFNADIIPTFNPAVKELPAAVVRLRQQMQQADALLISTPEYSFSTSGALKNATEWASLPPAPPFAEKPTAIMGASVSPLGTARGQAHLRLVLSALNAFLVNLPHTDITEAMKKFDQEKRLTDQASRDQVTALLKELQKHAGRLK
jgi:chromate reductase, NAD(P)H dehydrogenase (quinone)